MEFFENFRGELAGLGAAALWALSSAVYTLLGQKIPPLYLNFLKGSIAIILIFLTLIIRGESFEVPLISVLLLLTSGAIGIGLGDTAYFKALNLMGPRRTLLLETLSPSMGALLAIFVLGESLEYRAYFGMILTLFGVAWVISERTLDTGTNLHLRGGIIWGIIAALCQALGAVLSRYALLESGLSPLNSTFLRLLAGTGIVLILILLQGKQLDDRPILLLSWRLVGIITLTAFGSTYLGIWLQQTALKYSPVGIAGTLTATSPLFILPIAAMMGDKIGVRSLFGVIVALIGIRLLFG